jgi:hypothetical protein
MRADEVIMARSITRLGVDPGDAASAFLDNLAWDIVTRPERLTTLPDGLREAIERLTRGVPVAHDEPLDDAVEL